LKSSTAKVSAIKTNAALRSLRKIGLRKTMSA
jgi:hypothetical protein